MVLGGVGVLDEEAQFCFQQTHTQAIWINDIAQDLACLERCVGELCDLRERYVCFKGPLGDLEFNDMIRAMARWTLLLDRLCKALYRNSYSWATAHIEKILSYCLNKGCSNYEWLAAFALRNSSDLANPPRAHQFQSILAALDSACSYLYLYEAWCLLKNPSGTTDIHGELARVICMHPLVRLSGATALCCVPPKPLRGWVLLAMFRKYLAKKLDENSSLKLVDGVLACASMWRVWRVGMPDLDDTVVSLASDGSAHIGVVADLSEIGGIGWCWVLPWGAIYEALRVSENKKLIAYLLDRIRGTDAFVLPIQSSDDGFRFSAGCQPGYGGRHSV